MINLPPAPARRDRSGSPRSAVHHGSSPVGPVAEVGTSTGQREQIKQKGTRHHDGGGGNRQAGVKHAATAIPAMLPVGSPRTGLARRAQPARGPRRVGAGPDDKRQIGLPGNHDSFDERGEE